MENNNQQPAGLPETIVTVLNALSGMNAEFSFDFNNIEVQLPSANAAAGPDTTIRLNGSLRVRTSGNRNQA